MTSKISTSPRIIAIVVLAVVLIAVVVGVFIASNQDSNPEGDLSYVDSTPSPKVTDPVDETPETEAPVTEETPEEPLADSPDHGIEEAMFAQDYFWQTEIARNILQYDSNETADQKYERLSRFITNPDDAMENTPVLARLAGDPASKEGLRVVTNLDAMEPTTSVFATVGAVYIPVRFTYSVDALDSSGELVQTIVSTQALTIKVTNPETYVPGDTKYTFSAWRAIKHL